MATSPCSSLPVQLLALIFQAGPQMGNLRLDCQPLPLKLPAPGRKLFLRSHKVGCFTSFS